MDIIIKDRTFDSGRASNGDANEPIIELKTAITDIVGACLISANVPFTYYVFDSSNNVFRIGATTVTIPPQTCNAISLPYVLTTSITTAGVSGAANYFFFVDNTTSQLVIYNTTSSFTMDFTASNNASDALGFAPSTYASATGLTVYGNDDVQISSAYHFIISPFTVNLSGPSQMYLHCRVIGPAMNGAITNDSNASDIIGDFRVNTNYQGTITYQNVAPVQFSAQIQSLRKVQLYLTTGSATDKTDLRGAKFQAKIRFFCRNNDTNLNGADVAGNRNIKTVDSGGRSITREMDRSGVGKRKVFG